MILFAQIIVSIMFLISLWAVNSSRRIARCSHSDLCSFTHTHRTRKKQADRQRLGDLELELSATRERMEGYDKEFSKLKNQEVTVRRLEEENRQLVAKVRWAQHVPDALP
jgi:hypothetical protein